MRHASIWGLLIGLLALPVLSESVIRYVDKDVSCPGTGDTASPYCSIQNALNVVNAGDIVRIRNSATPYNEEAMLTRSGALGNPIIIEPDVGHTPNLQRTNANAVNGALNVYNASHVTIQNLLFDNTGITASPRAGLLLRTTTTNMSGLRVLNNTFTGWGGNAANAAVVSSTGDPRGALIINSGYWSVTPFLEIRGTLVQGNTFTNNRQSAITVLYGPDTIMENNTITGTLCGHDTDTARNTMGIKVIACNFGNGCATNHIIRNNVIHDFEPMTSCGVTHSPGAFDTPAGIWCDVGLNNGLVEGNTVYNINQTASGVPNDSTGDSAGIYIEHNCNNWIVRNNLVHHIGQNGIKIRIANITQTPSTYLNNTVYSTWKGVRIMDGRFIMKNNILFDHSLAGIAFDSAQTLNLADINYNLFWDTTGGGAKVGAWGGGVMNFATWKSTTGYDLNSQNIDPRLANVGTADFRLCTAAATPDPSCVGASPAINAGTNVGIAFNGSAPDQGAIETGGAASTPAALWRLDETGTTTTAPDSSGNNTHLTLCNTTTCPQQGPTWIAGSVNNAASFDGTSDYMEVANSPFLEFTGDMTFAAWVGTTSAANQMLVSKENISACGTPYLFEMTAQQYSYYHCGPGSDEIVLFDAY